jgi:hypothetical protein
MRSDNPIHSNCSYLRLIALMGILLLLASCSPLTSVLRGAGGQDQGEQGGQQAAQPSQQGAVGQSGDNGPGSDEEDVGNAEVIPPVAGVCPQEPQQAILFINHTFDWSPNRDKSIAEIKGHTGASEPCPLTIKGSKVTAAPCKVSYSNSGDVHGTSGDCKMQGQGQAEVTIEGSCSEGVVTLTIMEVPADEKPNAALSCPNKVTPYLPYYPPSLTTRTFVLQVGGDEAFEDADPDVTNQFAYHKTWSLSVESLLNPELPSE